MALAPHVDRHGPRMVTRYSSQPCPFIANQIINPNPSFDLTRDLAPIALLASGAVVLVVNSEINVHSVAELVALAKSKPGQLLHATVSPQIAPKRTFILTYRDL